MTRELEARARGHLLRPDGQEDVCLATYAPSTGERRTTGVLTDLVLPLDGERSVHGNASFSGRYVVRAASQAAEHGRGIALLHSHPESTGWQEMSGVDRDTEHSYARVAETITGHPLVGLTVAADATWSARFWDSEHGHRDAESVRITGTALRVCWNGRLRPPPAPTSAQVRTVSAWGEAVQADLARLRVLVVGVGTVGLDLAIRLVQAGAQDVSVMDFDTVEEVNLDRLLTATRTDAALFRSKIHVALRAMRAATTAAKPVLSGYDLSICEPQGQRTALDHDVIFSCVDRPWARAVLNQLAYSDLIPVIDGGLALEPFPNGGMRNATWRAHVVTPGRPCLQCNGQIDGAQVARDRAGLFDDTTYIRTAGLKAPSRENVSLLAPSVTASMLAQFVSLAVTPGGLGAPDPLRFSLSTHTLEHMPVETLATCPYEQATGWGDRRPTLAKHHPAAEAARRQRETHARTGRVRAGRVFQNLIGLGSVAIQRLLATDTDRDVGMSEGSGGVA
ncbi:ThiF family adenylyltransferase [Micromonospora coerulea]|uniref:ThiF family adenylyltransferase n=1 Tax=Micromonospora coerulea TaxID=47856 RepID=UPI001903E0E1|nr:ThiF family adenylyltransferase [Micromonospora veneta]